MHRMLRALALLAMLLANPAMAELAPELGALPWSSGQAPDQGPCDQ